VPNVPTTAVTSAVVIDASAPVEIAADGAPGRRLSALLPPDAELSAPEHFYSEAAGALRRLTPILGTLTESKAHAALDALFVLPVRRVSVRYLVSEAWTVRLNGSVEDAL
jgi:predicted nucleic acid-binding protein